MNTNSSLSISFHVGPMDHLAHLWQYLNFIWKTIGLKVLDSSQQVK